MYKVFPTNLPVDDAGRQLIPTERGRLVGMLARLRASTTNEHTDVAPACKRCAYPFVFCDQSIAPTAFLGQTWRCENCGSASLIGQYYRTIAIFVRI
jgi:hypothetical protein